MAVTLERTDTAFVIKLPLTMNPVAVQKALEHLQLVEVMSRSKATQDDIDALAKEVKAGWSAEMKTRLAGMEEFKDI